MRQETVTTAVEGLPAAVSAIPYFVTDWPDVPMARLDAVAEAIHGLRARAIGYPNNQNTDLEEFYRWYEKSKLFEVALNNVGDPRQPSIFVLNTHQLENEVIDFFAPLYGFSLEDCWGMVTNSGTDGNMHGMYFGVKTLQHATRELPICYVSEEAHYSIKRLADLMNLELRLIKTDKSGRMRVAEFERVLEPTRAALVVVAMGTTFKGAIDDRAAINAVVQEKKPVGVYVHLDAALFGGYLPFTTHRDLVDRRVASFDSIAVSGHKFFGSDEPMGLFLTTKATVKRTNPFKVTYLNEAVPTISCSRSALSVLKFWWKVQKTGKAGFEEQAQAILAMAQYLKGQLDKLGHEAWRDEHSNTVYFHRPAEAIMKKYDLAPDNDDRLGGALAHIVVMQHVTVELVDHFIDDLKAGGLNA